MAVALPRNCNAYWKPAESNQVSIKSCKKVSVLTGACSDNGIQREPFSWKLSAVKSRTAQAGQVPPLQNLGWSFPKKKSRNSLASCCCLMLQWVPHEMKISRKALWMESVKGKGEGLVTISINLPSSFQRPVPSPLEQIATQAMPATTDTSGFIMIRTTLIRCGTKGVVQNPGSPIIVTDPWGISEAVGPVQISSNWRASFE